MTKQTKIWVGVGAVALYLLWKNKSSAPMGSVGDETVVGNTLSDGEKQDLFLATLGYQGGVAPSKETRDKYNTYSKEALAKVEVLGLSAELKAWNESRKDFPLPQSAKNQGGGDYPMATFQF